MNKEILKAQFMLFVENAEFKQAMEKSFEKAVNSGCIDVETASSITAGNIFTAAVIDMADKIRPRTPEASKEVKNILNFI